MTMTYEKRVLEAFSSTGPFTSSTLVDSQSWLGDVIGTPVSAEIESVIDSLRNKEPEYEPLLFDLYIGDAASALDRCLRLRREIQDLEATAVSFARQYARQEETRDIDAELDDRALQIAQARKLQIGFSEAAKKLKPDVPPPLGEGLAIQSTAISMSHGDTADEEARRSKLTAKRRKILEGLIEAERNQHTVPGHSLNFSERRDRLVQLLRRDLSEAYKKCVAVKEGVKVIYGATSFAEKVPTAGESNVLDRLVTWARDAIEFLERSREREVEFDLVVPLIQKAFDRQRQAFGVGASMTPLHDPSGNGVFTVDLAPWIGRILGEVGGKPRVAALRLQALGVSVSIDNHDYFNHRSTIFTVVVFPPATPRVLDGSISDWHIRPPIILGDVRPAVSDAPPVSFESGVGARNQRVTGEWRVKVLPNAASGMAAEPRSTADAGITDVRLHLRLIGIPINDISGW